MKFFIKCLTILLTLVLSLAIFDTVYNGLLKGDGYHPVTDQMREVSGD